jgi:hypothetical protein
MVTPEERITRLEAVQEASLLRFGDIISRQDALLLANESLRRDMMQAMDSARQEAREANDAARKEAREDNEAARKEAREDNEAARKEAREDKREDNEAVRREAREGNEAARKESRNLFIAGFSIGAALFTGFGAGTITLLFRVLERLPA